MLPSIHPHPPKQTLRDPRHCEDLPSHLLSFKDRLNKTVIINMPNYVRYFPNVWLGQMNLHLYLEILDFRYDELNIRGQIPEDTAMVSSIQGRHTGIQLLNRRLRALNQLQYLRCHQNRSPLFIS